MNEILLVTLVIGVLVLVIGIIITVVVLKGRKEGKYQETNYRALFIMGICFLPAGIPLSIATNNPGLLGISGLGLIYLSIGLANRDKWINKK